MSAFNQEKTLSRDAQLDYTPDYTCPPPPSYTFDEEKDLSTFNEGKKSSTICPEQQDVPDTKSSSIPLKQQQQQQQQQQEFYEAIPYDQRRVGCLSLFWAVVIFDIFATIVAIIGTVGATLKCKAHCGDVCDPCNDKSRKGSAAVIVIFVILTTTVILIKILSNRRRKLCNLPVN